MRTHACVDLKRAPKTDPDRRIRTHLPAYARKMMENDGRNVEVSGNKNTALPFKFTFVPQ